MCVYVFNPGTEAQIEYAAESITFYRKGAYRGATVELVLDLLITNKTQAPINTLYVVCPWAFYSFYRTTQHRQICDAINETSTFLETDHIYNHLLRSHPCKPDVSPLPNGRVRVTSEQPDPNIAGTTRTYTGVMNGSKAPLTLWADITQIQRYLLTNLPQPFTILEWKLDDPIKPDESHWIRWRMTKSSRARGGKERLQRLKDLALNRLFTRYHINGPSDVAAILTSYSSVRTDSGKFSISFTIQDPNYLIRLLPWIALLLGIISFIRNI